MLKMKRLLIATAVAASTLMASFSADAFFGPFNWMRSGGWGVAPGDGVEARGDGEAIPTMAGDTHTPAGVTHTVVGDIRIPGMDGALRGLARHG